MPASIAGDHCGGETAAPESAGRQELVLVSDLIGWSVKDAKKFQVFHCRHLEGGAWDHSLEVELGLAGQLEFQVLDKDAGWDWCLHPAWEQAPSATLAGDKSAVSAALSVLRGDATGKNFRVSEASKCRVVIHVEVQGRDFSVWYERLPMTAVDRMATLPSWHPMVQAAAVAPTVQVAHAAAAAAPPGILPERLQRGGEARRHSAASEDFAGLLLQMREESPGGFACLEGLRRLFQCGIEQRASAEALDAVADSELLDMGNVMEKVEMNMRHAQHCEDRFEYGRLFRAIEAEVGAIGVHCEVETDLESSSNWMSEFSYQLTLGIIFVHLPMVVYVQNSEHLYEMLARMNCDAARGCPSDAAGQPAAASGRERLREALDAGGRPYSWLVFAIVAALQVLFRVRTQLLADSEFPFLPLLAANPVAPNVSSFGDTASSVAAPHAGRRSAGRRPEPEDARASGEEEATAEQRQRWADVMKSGRMYRGLWVPPVLDEDRARHPYSFNSFSRSLEGTLSVLEFYGKVLPIARPPDWHVLLLIGDGWYASPWVMPVQFWAGSGMGDDEQELLVPPFMSFTFEQVELNSGMSEGELQRNAAALAQRWYGAGAARPGVDALELLGGPLLARLLARDLGLLRQMGAMAGAAWRGVSKGPYVTVRFIARMFPRPAIRALLASRKHELLAFPQLR